MRRLTPSVLAAALLASAVAAPLRAQDFLLGVDTRLNRVVKLHATTGAVLDPSFILDANSASTYDFQTPRAAIQVGTQVWVSDQSPSVNAIYRFDLASGAYLGRVGGNVAGGGLSNVRGMRVIGGTVYVVNAGTTNGAPGPAIVRVATDGSILGSFTTTVGSTIGLQPWDVVQYGGRLLVSDGTSRALQLYEMDGTHHGAFSGALNNIPQQMFVRANGHVLLAANGSQPLGSFGAYELSATGQVLRSWTNTPGLGARGIHELRNGRYLLSESGGGSVTRGLGTIDPNGVASASNFTLIEGRWNGGWISPVSVVPEPGTVGLLATGLAGVAAGAWRRRRA